MAPPVHGRAPAGGDVPLALVLARGVAFGFDINKFKMSSLSDLAAACLRFRPKHASIVFQARASGLGLWLQIHEIQKRTPPRKSANGGVLSGLSGPHKLDFCVAAYCKLFAGCQDGPWAHGPTVPRPRTQDGIWSPLPPPNSIAHLLHLL